MFEWLIGIPLLIITLFAGFTLPKYISWPLFIVVAVVWTGFLPGLESGIDTLRSLVGLGG